MEPEGMGTDLPLGCLFPFWQRVRSAKQLSTGRCIMASPRASFQWTFLWTAMSQRLGKGTQERRPTWPQE